MRDTPFSVEVTPNWQGFVSCILREGTPDRVYFMELLMDLEVETAICERYGLLDDLDPADPFFQQRRLMTLQRFLGYDYVRMGLDGWEMPLHRTTADDTAELAHAGGRAFMDQHEGPITTWEEFENYPWPDPDACSTRSLEFFSENLPDGMCIVGGRGFAHFAEYLSWLMGYETLCFALYDQRDLVAAISRKLNDMFARMVERFLQFDRVKLIWGSDDMGFRTATLIAPDDLREFVLPGHKLLAQKAHEAGRPYIIHSCGNLEEIMVDLIEDVGIDAKHSFEDTIESVVDAKRKYGDRIAVLGGIDMDFLCRADEGQVRRRVRETLEKCMPGGGYCLGTGNSVANYIPLDNYLAMLDEGRKFKP